MGIRIDDDGMVFYTSFNIILVKLRRRQGDSDNEMLCSMNHHVQSNFNGSNIIKTMEICSSDGEFEPLRFNHNTRSGSKW